MEILIYAILGLTVAERRCGFPPHKEVIVVFGLLGANLLIPDFAEGHVVFPIGSTRNGEATRNIRSNVNPRLINTFWAV